MLFSGADGCPAGMRAARKEDRIAAVNPTVDATAGYTVLIASTFSDRGLPGMAHPAQRRSAEKGGSADRAVVYLEL